MKSDTNVQSYSSNRTHCTAMDGKAWHILCKTCILRASDFRSL